MSGLKDLDYLRSLNKKDLTKYLKPGWWDDCDKNPLFVIITEEKNESFDHIFNALGEQCIVDLLLSETFRVPLIFWILLPAAVKLSNICLYFLHKFSAKELERLLKHKHCGTSVFWLIALTSIAGYDRNEVVLMQIYELLGEQKCIDSLISIGLTVTLLQTVQLDEGKIACNRRNLPIFTGDLSDSELERFIFTRNTLGLNNLYILMLRISPEGLAELRDRLGAERLVNSLIEQRRTGEILSSVLTGALNVFITKMKLPYISLKPRKGIPDISLLALDQTEKTEINIMLEIFTIPDRKKLLAAEDIEGNNVLYYILRSKGSVDKIQHLCLTLGADWCLKELLHKNSKGNSSLGQAFLGEHDFNVCALLDEFTNFNLQRIANDRTSDGRYTLVHALKVSLPLVKLCCEKLGKERCIDLMIAPDINGNSGIVRAMQSEVNLQDIFSCFGTGDELLIAKLLSGQNSSGKNLIYHMIMDSNTTMPTLRSCIMDIYEALGEKECTKILAGTIESSGSLSLIQKFPRFSLFEELNAFVSLLEGWHKSSDEIESDKNLNQLIAICNTNQSFRTALVGFIDRNQSEFPLSWKLIQNKIKWIRRQVQKNNYFLLTQPSILLISNSQDRPRADEEMTSLTTALSVLDLEVTTITNLSKKDTLAEIRRMQQSESSHQCQIVIMMSHGKAGHILDNNGVPIPLKELEKEMCPKSHTNSPKVLILQCCQNDGDYTLASNYSDARLVGETDARRCHEDAGPASSQARSSQLNATVNPPTYAPTNDNFCTIMPCVHGQVSFRNEFIPKLGATLQTLLQDEDLFVAHQAAHRALVRNQTPIFQSTMMFKFSLKNVYVPEDTAVSGEKPGCVLS